MQRAPARHSTCNQKSQLQPTKDVGHCGHHVRRRQMQHVSTLGTASLSKAGDHPWTFPVPDPGKVGPTINTALFCKCKGCNDCGGCAHFPPLYRLSKDAPLVKVVLRPISRPDQLLGNGTTVAALCTTTAILGIPPVLGPAGINQSNQGAALHFAPLPGAGTGGQVHTPQPSTSPTNRKWRSST